MPKAQPSTRSSFIQEYIANDYPNYSKGSAQTLYSVLNKAELYADKIGKPLLSFLDKTISAVMNKTIYCIN